MASFTKTIQTALASLQSLAAGAVLTSSALSVPTALAATIYMRVGRTIATAMTAGLIYRVETSAEDTGDSDWYPLGGATFISNVAAVGDEAVSGTCAAGQNVVAMASTTGFAVWDTVFIKNGTFGNSEFGRIKTVTTNTSITLIDNLANAQTGSTVYAGAQVFTAANLDLSAVRRIRVVADGSAATQALGVQVKITTCDSIG